MSRLLVAAVLNDGQGSTNCVYISPTAAAPRFVNINGMIFTVRTDPTIPSGVICLNMLQRTSASVSTNANDSVDLAAAAAAVPAKPPVLGKVRIEMSYFSAAKTGGVIDYQQLIEFLGASFSGQFFTVNQQVLCLFDGQKYKATVKEVEAVDKTGGLDVPSGVFTRETMVIIDCNEKSALKLINIPAAQTDAQREVQVKSFDLNKLGIGGLDKEFGQVFRRAFASRIYPPSIVKRLGIAHVKGVLLYGPPGTGKTLIARKIGEILNAKSVQIVNGPEVFNKWVGGAAENIRKLFAEAEEDQKSKGDLSPLHLIIFDEFDSIAKQRGGGGTSSNVGDEVVNQLLSKIDGVNQLNNVLLIGMTNRKDLIDEAILRPGRFEVHVEIGLPDLKGREQILNIHTRRLVENGALAKDVHIPELAELSKNFSGAELRGLVDAASSHAFARHVDMEDPTKIKDAEHTMIERADFLKALREDIKPAFGQAEDALKNAVRRGIIDYGPTWAVLNRRATELPARLRNSRLPIFSVLVHGPPSSGKTALAAHMAIQSGFPFVKFVSNPPLTGYGELQKCNILRRAFDDSYKSPLSVIVLDDIERLIEYSALGGRYSNTILQALLVLIKNPPPDGRKLLVIGTTSNRAALQDLELTGVFSSEIEAPALGGDALEPLARGLHCKWHSPKALSLAAASMPSEMPLKTLIQVIEVAADAPEGSGPEDERIITYERFSDALMLVGTGM